MNFKNYSESLNGEDNVTLLHPRSFSEGYLVETGWATTNKNIDVPNFRTKWDIEGNNKLSPNNPIKLVWENKQNIKFLRSNVGDRYVKEMMHKYKFNLGGEQSGHIILGKFATTGDGLLVALEVLFSLRKGYKASKVLRV